MPLEFPVLLQGLFNALGKKLNVVLGGRRWVHSPLRSYIFKICMCMYKRAHKNTDKNIHKECLTHSSPLPKKVSGMPMCTGAYYYTYQY